MKFRAALAVVVLALPVFAGGCRAAGALAYYFGPRRIQKPEFVIEPGRKVALLIEAVRPAQENPVFDRALHERCVALLRDGGCKAEVLAYDKLFALRSRGADFSKWSIQEVGRRLGADYVLYVRLDDLVIRQTPDAPILTPSVRLHMKLIDVHQPPPHAHVWPADDDARLVRCSRHATTAADENPEAADTQARKLGYDTAYYVTMPFIKVDLEQSPPVEP